MHYAWFAVLLLAVPMLPVAAAGGPPGPVEEVNDLVQDCLFPVIPEDCLMGRLNDLLVMALETVYCLAVAGGPPCL